MEEQKEALWPTLMRFHREVIAPEVREIVSTEINKTVGALQNDLNAHFDGIYKRLDRVDSEISTLHLAVRRIDDRMDAIERRMAALEQNITDLAAKPEIEALRSKVNELEHEIAMVKQRLAEMESRQEHAS